MEIEENDIENQKQILEATRDTYLTFLKVLTPVILVTVAGIGTLVLNSTISGERLNFLIGILGLITLVEFVLLINVLFRIFRILKERKEL